MPKISKIKWRDRDTKRIERVVSEFNAKRQSVIAENPAAYSYLPNAVDDQALRADLQNKTRQDFNNTVNSLSRFLREGAENPYSTDQGVLISQYERDELRIQARTITNTRRNRLNEIEEASQTDQSRDQMDTVNRNYLNRPSRNLENVRPEEWDAFVASQARQSEYFYRNYESLENYKANYITAAINEFTDVDINSFIDRIQNIPAETLARIRYLEPDLDLQFLYDVSAQEVVYNRINSLLDKYDL